MFARLTDSLRNAPRNLADRGQQLRRDARERVATTRRDGRVRLWTLQVDTLERVEGLLDKAPEIPVISKAAERMVHQRIEAATTPPIDGYDDLSAKAIVSALLDQDVVGLLRIRRHELANKNRKTVLDAVERQLTRVPAAA